jgi:hypothetical protein
MRIYWKLKGQEVIYFTHLYIIHTKSKVRLVAKKLYPPDRRQRPKQRLFMRKRTQIIFTLLCADGS